MNYLRIYIGIAVLLTFVASGCAQKGPILVDFSYQVRPGVTADETPKAVVGVALFRDERGKSDSVAGRRFKSVSDEANDLVVQGTISQQVTEALKTALSVRDITVRDAPREGMPADTVDFVLTGDIKSFWVESLSTLAKTTMTARVDLRIVAEDPATKKVLHAVAVSSSLEEGSVVYSTSRVQKTLSEALTAAINQIFDDEEFKKRFK